jgi:hypothetical protein
MTFTTNTTYIINNLLTGARFYATLASREIGSRKVKMWVNGVGKVSFIPTVEDGTEVAETTLGVFSASLWL